jgi:multiple sugar transport system permease protein
MTTANFKQRRVRAAHPKAIAERPPVVRGVASILLVVVLALVWLFPILWTLVTSLKPDAAIATRTPSFVFTPTLDHYATLGQTGSFAQYMLNSAVVAIAATAIALATGTPAAYSIVRFGTGGSRMKLLILSSRMVPPIAIALPMFVVLQTIGMNGSLTGLILAHSATLAPFCTWLMIGFIQGVPGEIEEASLIDGCSRLGALVRIALPLMRPGIAVTGILALVASWNNLFYALVLTNGDSKTLPVAVSSFVTGYTIKWGELTAASMVVLLPPVILALLIQKHLVRGLTLGAVR